MHPRDVDLMQPIAAWDREEWAWPRLLEKRHHYALTALRVPEASPLPPLPLSPLRHVTGVLKNILKTGKPKQI